MAKTQKYSDELLLTAVIRYSEAFSGKIRASKLARWASENVEGLEGVRDYMFTRPVIVGTAKNGERKYENRPCLDRINEINAARSVTAAMVENALLHSSDPDAFMYLSRPQQRQAIIDTRKQTEELMKQFRASERENRILKSENEKLRELEEQLEEKCAAIQEGMDSLEKLLKSALRFVDEKNRREVLAGIGIEDDHFDFERNFRSLTISAEETFSIADALKSMRSGNTGTDASPVVRDDDAADLFDGLNF